MSLRMFRSRTLRRYAVALLAFGLSLLIRLLLSSALGVTVPYITFFPAIMVSAWYGGLGPGLITTSFSAIAAWYLFLEPSGWRQTELIGFLLFLAVGLRY
jgi:K+-sensing histidine kinase KdpD